MVETEGWGIDVAATTTGPLTYVAEISTAITTSNTTRALTAIIDVLDNRPPYWLNLIVCAPVDIGKLHLGG